MKLVTRDNLESWAKTTFSKSALPYLISRLVRATTPISTKADFPSGSATFIGGWDGIVSCEVDELPSNLLSEILFRREQKKRMKHHDLKGMRLNGFLKNLTSERILINLR